MAKSFLLILCLLHVFAGRAASAVANHRVLPFHQDVYVWQRDWNGPMRDALRMRGTTFHSVVALKAEVTWQDRQPVTTKIDLDYPLLTNVTRHPGLALRIGPVAWPFMGTNRVAADYLANLAARIVQESREAGLPLSELQVDYDCASSKLEDYAALVSYLKARIAPVPLVITALPDWIGKTGFGPLINAVDGFVLQVHSVQKPISFDAPFSLCDPAQAEYAINAAANYNKPFRVALPTYGYEMAFNADGRYIGLSAEGPRRTWPEGTRKEEVRANPLEIGRLALKLRQKRPEQLQGLIWYRFPVPGDTLNWQWPTLSAIVDARLPRKSVQVELHRVESGLVEIRLVNNGELDISSRLAVQARWSEARLIGGDALRGFELADLKSSSALFKAQAANFRLPAGENRTVGWLRLSGEPEVKLEIVD